MSEQVSKIVEWSESLTKAVEEHPYDCECQVGGVDAMSVDTDWLRVVAEKFAEAVALIKGEQK